MIWYSFCIFVGIYIKNEWSEIMDLNLLSEGKDPMGAAIYDYLKYGKAGRLRVFSSQFDEDEIPVAGLFRTYESMPELEQIA